jgi:hypothetical protein
LAAKRFSVFQDKKIRKIWHNNEWWFCLSDIVETLIHSKRPRYYLLDIRRRDHSLARLWPDLTKLLPLDTPRGRHELLCVNTLGFFRLAQSMPNKQVETWRLWLAQTAWERTRFIDDPMRAVQLARDLYKAKGHSDRWIAQKISGALLREELAASEKEKTDKDYLLFMAELSKNIQPVWQ